MPVTIERSLVVWFAENTRTWAALISYPYPRGRHAVSFTSLRQQSSLAVAKPPCLNQSYGPASGQSLRELHTWSGRNEEVPIWFLVCVQNRSAGPSSPCL